MHTLAGLLHANFRIPSSVDYTTFLRATRMLTRDEREVRMSSHRWGAYPQQPAPALTSSEGQ